MIKYFILLNFIFFFFFGALSVKADNVYVVIQKQQEQKKQSRWSLGEWMIQERKIHLMDQWLAMNTEEIGAEWRFHYSAMSFERNEDQNNTLNGSIYGLEVFYGFLGVGAEQIKADDESLLINTKIKIKLIGSSQQSTHLNIYYGLARGGETGGPDASLYGLEGDLYLYGGFGVRYLYEEYKPNSRADAVYFEGLRRENGLFLESGFIRLKYSIFEIDYRGNVTENKDKGNLIGVEFHF